MQGATKPDIRRSRRLARILAANPRAATYGTIVASAVIATTGGGHESPELILEATLATLVVFWLAELVTLAVLQALGGYVSEARWLRYARTHLRDLFPYLPGQAGYNKRLRAAFPLLRYFIRALAVDSDLWRDGPSWPLRVSLTDSMSCRNGLNSPWPGRGASPL